MTKKEWEQNKHKVVQRVDGIHTEKDLLDFSAKQMQIRMPEDNVKWGFYLIPDYKDGQGIVLFKAHHSFCDGGGMG